MTAIEIRPGAPCDSVRASSLWHRQSNNAATNPQPIVKERTFILRLTTVVDCDLLNEHNASLFLESTIKYKKFLHNATRNMSGQYDFAKRSCLWRGCATGCPADEIQAPQAAERTWIACFHLGFHSQRSPGGIPHHGTHDRGEAHGIHVLSGSGYSWFGHCHRKICKIFYYTEMYF